MEQNDFDIFLIDPFIEDPPSPINQQQILRIPVLPEEISIRTDRKYETIDFCNLGEVDFQSGEKLQQIEFSSFFPAEYDPSYCQYPDIPDPLSAWNLIYSLTVAREKPIRLIITGADINMLVNIAANTAIHKGGEPGDIYYEIICRTWRETKVIIENINNGQPNNNQLNARTNFKQTPKSYVVKTGDCLWTISKRELGTSSRWRDIYNLNPNPNTIGPDPNLIYPGQRLVMPA